MKVSEQIPDNIKRVSRSVGYALWLNSVEDWFGLSVILKARLGTSERVSLAYMALKSLGDDLAAETAGSVLGLSEPIGSPITPFDGVAEEAEFWADMAAPEELDAYCLATFKRMTPDRRAAFLNHFQGKTAA